MVSKLFPTKRSPTERGKVWETMADKLCAFREPTSVRDHYKKIINRHKRRMNEEKAASGISSQRTTDNRQSEKRKKMGQTNLQLMTCEKGHGEVT